MYRARSIILLAVFVLLLGAFAPDSEAGRNCNCTMCQPPNLLTQCNWPGYGIVYCVDYWEFQCNGAWLAANAAQEAAGEPLVCSATEETEASPQVASSETDGDDEDPADSKAEWAEAPLAETAER